MAQLDLKNQPHRRFNPLTREWVVVSPNRTQRPWLGQLERVSAVPAPAYDPACYMCPGNVRAKGERNPAYTGVLVFDNDYPGLVFDNPAAEFRQNDLLVARSESGICRVICFSPRHNQTLETMGPSEVRGLVEVWIEQVKELGAKPEIHYVQIFENRGAAMGASNPHPHGQLWATASVPNEPAKEDVAQKEYFGAHGGCLLCEYLAHERTNGDRLIFENEHFVVLVPFWAIWPFEVMVISRRHAGAMPELNGDEKSSLAETLQQLTRRYDRLFETLFPYSMGFHQYPTDGQPHPEWHLHAHFYPPLLRSATIRKFMVGFEMLGTPQRDITAEAAAALLRNVE